MKLFAKKIEQKKLCLSHISHSFALMLQVHQKAYIKWAGDAWRVVLSHAVKTHLFSTEKIVLKLCFKKMILKFLNKIAMLSQ